jgi:hypothetical protein
LNRHQRRAQPKSIATVAGLEQAGKQLMTSLQQVQSSVGDLDLLRQVVVEGLGAFDEELKSLRKELLIQQAVNFRMLAHFMGPAVLSDEYLKKLREVATNFRAEVEVSGV